MFKKPVKPKSKVKKTKSPFEFSPAHADQRAGPSVAAGNYYGVGVKNKMGRIRDTSSPGVNPVSKKKLGTPPKSIV